MTKSNYFMCCLALAAGMILSPGPGAAVYAQDTRRILCLGDSVTFSGGPQAYPAQLEVILNERGKGARFQVINAGDPGATSFDIADAFSEQIRRYAPDMIVVMMGINDESTPVDYSPFTRLGWAYKEKGERGLAAESFEKAVKFNPAGYREHTEFGIFCLKSGDFKRAESLLKEAIAINGVEDEAYIVLGWCYLAQDRFADAEAVFAKARGLNPRNPNISGGLAIVCEQKGDHVMAREYYEKAGRLRRLAAGTVRNFQRVRDMAAKEGIPLVWAQYPMRDILGLKRALGDPGKMVLFADNDRVFKDAVRQHGYSEYFEDMFAGESGHCTAKGNRLLAQTISGCVLKYYSP